MDKIRNMLILLLMTVVLFAVPTYAAVTITPSSMTLYTEEDAKISMKGTASTVKWLKGKFQGSIESTGKTTATVKAGTKTGTYWIAGQVGTKKYHCKIIVVPSPKLSATSITLYKGNTKQLTVTDAKKRSVSWSSSNTAVASVSSKGVVTAKGVGKATISAKNGIRTVKCTVTVKTKEQSVKAKLDALKSKYPQGMKWTNQTPYSMGSPYALHSGVCIKYNDYLGYNGGAGCAAFVLKVSDEVFGRSVPYTAHKNFRNIKIGDIVSMLGPHFVIAINRDSEGIYVAEGNFNEMVNWGRYISFSTLNREAFIVNTRY